MHAHRIGRRILDRATYLEHAATLLNDPEAAAVRSAIGTVSHGGYRPAIPTVVGLLAHAHPMVRRAAADELVRWGRRWSRR
ncbi:hypothetical protein [Micromonospora taraxaci]|uniref:hypothetical protein n=1 Tax=Micromonospora taraxaci TaxID=1316803 RepID=UPI0033BF8645